MKVTKNTEVQLDSNLGILKDSYLTGDVVDDSGYLKFF